MMSLIVPYLNKQEDYILLAYVMVTLKLEGVLGETLTSNDKKMLAVIKESLQGDSKKKHHALLTVKKIMKSLPSSC